MNHVRRSPAQSWLNRTVFGIALASLFSDWSHEIATAVLPAFLGSLGVAAAWLGIIEGISDGLSSFAKLGSGFTPMACLVVRGCLKSPDSVNFGDYPHSFHLRNTWAESYARPVSVEISGLFKHPLKELLCRGRFRDPSRHRKTPSVSTVCTRTV